MIHVKHEIWVELHADKKYVQKHIFIPDFILYKGLEYHALQHFIEKAVKINKVETMVKIILCTPHCHDVMQCKESTHPHGPTPVVVYSTATSPTNWLLQSHHTYTHINTG